MAKLNKQAIATIADLAESLQQRMEAEIVELTPDQRRQFEAALAAGKTRYDALLEVVLSGTERSRFLRPDRFRYQN